MSLEPLSLKAAIEVVKKMGQINKAISDVEFKEAIVDLRALLLDAQENILDFRDENLSLKKQISDLKNTNAARSDKINVEGFSYDSTDGKPVGLPYCPTCLVKEGKYYRLSKGNDQFSKCLNCSKTHNAAANGRVNQPNPPSARNQPSSRNKWVNY